MSNIKGFCSVACTHYNSEFNDEIGKTIRTCAAGKQQEMDNWWKENGPNVATEASYIDCYTPTEHTKKLQNLIDMTDQLLDIVK